MEDFDNELIILRLGILIGCPVDYFTRTCKRKILEKRENDALVLRKIPKWKTTTDVLSKIH